MGYGSYRNEQNNLVKKNYMHLEGELATKNYRENCIF